MSELAGEGLELPETIINPLACNVFQAVGDSEEMRLQFVAASHVYTIRLPKRADQRVIAEGLLGGDIVLAGADELPQGEPT